METTRLWRIPPSVGRFGTVLNGTEIIQTTVVDCHGDKMEGNNHIKKLACVPSQFTGEETILLRRLAAGSSVKQIGRQLRLSRPALLRQLGDLRRRVSVDDDVELAAWARRWER
jgi:DNA-binding NarL/FixJ family response regulator